jgi:uncharacterized protein YjiK
MKLKNGIVRTQIYPFTPSKTKFKHTLSIIKWIKQTRFYMGSLVLLIFSLFACQPAANTEEAPTGITLVDGYTFNYKLNEPTATFKLPAELEEISGLGISPDGKKLVAVQDENGKLFFINRVNGEVVKEFKFWKDGDYEGVEWVGDKVYVVKSSGTIYEVTDFDDKEPPVEKYNFFLDSDNDVEGLGYDAQNGRLLLACKAKAGREEDFKYKKGIYSFDLSSKELAETPVYFINLDSVNNYLQKEPAIRKLEKLIEFFDPGEPFGFAPSGLAVHPRTGNLYITSSVGKLLMVLDPQGTILHIEKLDKDIHRQPEGLCFAQDGTLYISNEGKGGRGRILVFPSQ